MGVFQYGPDARAVRSGGGCLLGVAAMTLSIIAIRKGKGASGGAVLLLTIIALLLLLWWGYLVATWRAFMSM